MNPKPGAQMQSDGNLDAPDNVVRPSPQDVWFDAPSRQKDPIGHVVQFVAPKSEYVPAAHLPVTADRPVSAQ
jgi:hypothetical protein